ncbi:MAG TPA: hypothetical protein VKW06_05750 [Candidatus Angelobacter sp.]|nr:hypothetical protein [Candidatus Angelobacter sp.]
MRRLISISAICALLALPAAPLVAASCPHARMATACHRTEHAHVHHCETMDDDASVQAAESESENRVIAGSSASQDCPMDCCSASQRTGSIAVTASFEVTQFAASEQNLLPVPIVFSTPGFSSHTDRGPPTA